MAGEHSTFGPFQFDFGRGVLLREGAPVAVSGRGIALLTALVRADGGVVSKAELMDAAWPGVAIEESNLTVQVAALRKAMGTMPDGSEWIATVPRVGYRFLRANGVISPDPSGAGAPPPPVLPARPSIAVLPFNNMSSDPEQEYFADGLSEDLITDLSKVPGLVVIARNSSFAYKGKPLDVRVVARELGVRYIIEGSVRRAAARVRINAQIIDATDHSHLWADRFDRDLADIFALQDEIVGRIVHAFAGVLPSAEVPSTRRATSIEAYDLFTRGRVLILQSPAGNRAARPLLERAVALDPGFSEAHAWLAMLHVEAWAYWGEPMEKHQPLALPAARRAVAADPDNADAHANLGYVLMFGGEPETGAAELATALRINPNHANAWTYSGELKAHRGNASAGIDDIHKAFRLNPHPPGFYYWILGYAEYAARRYEDAIATLSNEATRRSGSQRILAASLAQLGRIDEAKKEAGEFLTMVPNFSARRWVATQPFKHDADREHFIEGYRKAGLPV